jgi:multicomponent Na+:H+ antiporter subunit F
VSGAVILQNATAVAMGLLLAAMLLAVIRLIRGPTLPDRILALDLLTTLAIGFIATFAIRSGLMLYLDLAIALGLVGFLSTVALARYVLHHARAGRSLDAGAEEQSR